MRVTALKLKILKRPRVERMSHTVSVVGRATAGTRGYARLVRTPIMLSSFRRTATVIVHFGHGEPERHGSYEKEARFLLPLQCLSG